MCFVMPKPDTLTIIHYHLLPGGVSSALKLSLTGLARSGWFFGRTLRLLVGREAGIENFTRLLEPNNLMPEVEVDSRLDYSARVWPDRGSFYNEASALASWLLEQAKGDTLYWAHNPTLGKNPLLTGGLQIAAREAERSGLPHRFLYHIHDFAECGRLRNLMYLRRCWVDGGLEEFYPTGENVGYAVLNSVDSSRLAQVGVPEPRIFLLSNTVQSPDPGSRLESRATIASLLQDYSQDHGYRFDPMRPWWTLPMRLIRRKNVVEALSLAAIAGEPPQLLVTLDANSEPERPYAEAVKKLFRNGNHAAVVGFGHELVGKVFGLHDLIMASDAVVTTSLLEGFGFAFLEGPNRGRPLLGRNLWEVTEDFVDSGFPAASLYEHFLVPVARSSRKKLAARGCAFARRYGPLIGLSRHKVDAFIAAVGSLFSKEVVDFGNLDLQGQVDFARRLHEVALVKELATLNAGAAQPVVFPADFPTRIEERFGLEPHAQRLAAAFESLFSMNRAGEIPDNISSRLVELFFDPRYHRPLTGDW
jgi:hypothetical protein